MKTFLEFSNTNLHIESIIQEFIVLSIVANDNQIDEGLTDSIKSKITAATKKSGLRVSKAPGLISYLLSGSKSMSTMMLAAVKGDKAEVKRIAASLKKETVLDFLLKLDVISLHIFTAPIHIIDAVTNWDIMGTIERATKGTADAIKDAIDKIREVIKLAPDDKIKTQMHGYIQGLRRILLGNS